MNLGKLLNPLAWPSPSGGEGAYLAGINTFPWQTHSCHGGKDSLESQDLANPEPSLPKGCCGWFCPVPFQGPEFWGLSATLALTNHSPGVGPA